MPDPAGTAADLRRYRIHRPEKAEFCGGRAGYPPMRGCPSD